MDFGRIYDNKLQVVVKSCVKTEYSLEIQKTLGVNGLTLAAVFFCEDRVFS